MKQFNLEQDENYEVNIHINCTTLNALLEILPCKRGIK